MLILDKTRINILVDVHFLIPTFQVVLIHINKVGNRINKVGHETTKWVNESTKWVNESTSWTAPNQPRGSRQLYGGKVGAQFSYTLVDVFSFIQQTLFCRIARVAIVRFLGLNRTNSKMNQSNSPFGTEAISNWKRKRNMWRMNWRWNLGGTQHQQWQIWMHRSQKWRAGHHQQCIEIVLYRLFYTNIAIASTIRYAMPMNGSATVWRSRGLEDHFAMITQEFRSSLTLKHQSVSTFLINHPNRHYHCHNHSQQLFSPAMFMKCQAFHVDHS